MISSTQKKISKFLLLFLLGLFLLSPFQISRNHTAHTPTGARTHIELSIARAQEEGGSNLWTLFGLSGAFSHFLPSTSEAVGSSIKEFLAFLFSWVLNLVGILLGIAGMTLDNAITISVVHMKSFIEAVKGINIAWTLIRDLLNIVILFLLLFSAIGVILRTDKLIPKSALVQIIIAALLINFSLFFTKAIIDVSNVFSYQIYSAIKVTGDDSDSVFTGITGAFMQGLDLQTKYSLCGKEQELCVETDEIVFENNLIVRTIMGIITILITAFVFFVAAILLIIRFGLLVFLLITSPVGFVGGLIPKLQDQAKEWWQTLIGQALFLPVLLIFLLLIAKLLDPASGFEAAMSALDVQAGPADRYFGSGGLVSFIQFCIIIFFLITSIVVTKKISGKTGEGAVKFATKWGGKAAFGGAAWAGANTIGRLGKGLAESDFANRLQGSNSAFARLAGQGLINAGKGIGNASFDIRGAGFAKELGAGKAADGYIKREKAEAKRIADAREKITPQPEKGAWRDANELRKALEENEGVRTSLREQIEKERRIEQSDLTTDAQKASARAERERLEKEEEKWKEKEKRLAELDRDNPMFQQQRQKEARAQIAELARKLSSRQIRNAHDAANQKDPERRESMIADLHGKEQEIANAIVKLSSATENIKNARNNMNQRFIDQNAQAGGALGAAVANMQKEMRKSKEQKILENAIKAESEKGGGDSGDKGGGKKDGDSGKSGEEKT